MTISLRRDCYNNITYSQVLQHFLLTHFRRPSSLFFVGLIPSLPTLPCESRLARADAEFTLAYPGRYWWIWLIDTANYQCTCWNSVVFYCLYRFAINLIWLINLLYPLSERSESGGYFFSLLFVCLCAFRPIGLNGRGMTYCIWLVREKLRIFPYGQYIVGIVAVGSRFYWVCLSCDRRIDYRPYASRSVVTSLYRTSSSTASYLLLLLLGLE